MSEDPLVAILRPDAVPEGDPADDYIQPLAAFLDEEDVPVKMIFPEILPASVIMLLHGEPRARKSLTAFELALSAATGTAPFHLKRLTPDAPIAVLYIQEEDPRGLTRPRLRTMVRDRCGDQRPDALFVSIRRGVNLDDPAWVKRLIGDLQRRGIKLLVLDAARRLSAKTDEGPAKVSELMRTLRLIVTTADVTIVIVHHDVKPPTTGHDQRRRSQRASGGDWFAGCECPVHVERVSATESLLFPQDYKFSADPAPITFALELEGKLVRRLVGTETTTDEAEHAGIRGRVLDWLRANGPATKTAMQKATLGQWESIQNAVDVLAKEGTVDAIPGRKAGSWRYFAVGNEPSTGSAEGSSGASND